MQENKQGSLAAFGRDPPVFQAQAAAPRAPFRPGGRPNRGFPCYAEDNDYVFGTLLGLGEEERRALAEQDVIYVGGGNTVNLLAVWRAHGVDRLLREALARGTLLCGISAGANCWAEGSHTDSFGPLTHLPDGLGLLPGSVCPHYDSEQGRRASYRWAVASRELPSGWALEDGVGALFTEGRLTDSVTRLPRARLYRVEPDGTGEAKERAVPCRLL